MFKTYQLNVQQEVKPFKNSKVFESIESGVLKWEAFVSI